MARYVLTAKYTSVNVPIFFEHNEKLHRFNVKKVTSRNAALQVYNFHESFINYKLLQRLLYTLLLVVSTIPYSFSQNICVSGTVYDVAAKHALEGISVLSSAGRVAVSDSAGHYTIDVPVTDSIWFSFLNKASTKYAVNVIINPTAFDVGLKINVFNLSEVKVHNRDYHLDSLRNRAAYLKYFTWQKSTGFKLVPGSNGVGAGLDIDELINTFRFQHNRHLQYLQTRLIREEEDGFINRRFNKVLVRKLTGIKDDDELSDFMNEARPSYEQLCTMNDLELGYYVEQRYKEYYKKYNDYIETPVQNNR